jgi:chromosome segregation ATPase
MNLAES